MNKRRAQPTRKQEAAVIPTPEGVTFTPEEIAALRAFHQQAHNLWNEVGRIQCVLRASMETLRVDDSQADQTFMWLCSVNEGVRETLTLCIDSLMRRANGIDYAHIDLPDRVEGILCQGFATVERESNQAKTPVERNAA